MVMGSLVQEADLVVIGAGPGGYVAALRAADLGREVTLVEARPQLGGVCLLEGCIPSKTLIAAVEVADAAREAARWGLSFDAPRVDLERLRAHVSGVVGGLSRGIDQLVAGRSIEVVHGQARFLDPHRLALTGGEVAEITFREAIIATGSRPRGVPWAEGRGVWTSREALGLPEIPGRLAVVGGGTIGLELAGIYAGLGSEVTVLEFDHRLLAGLDPELVDVMLARLRRRLKDIRIDQRVRGLTETDAGFVLDLEAEGRRDRLAADRVLVAVGREPNTDDLDLAHAGLAPDEHGRIPVDEQGRTAQRHLFAIGDVVAGPMLAHKASREGKVAAEALTGQPSAFDNRAIPAVVYTDPEIAWAGLTEPEARARGVAVKVGRFPLRALGRARTLGRTDGLAKIIAAADTGLVLGVGLVGPQASELISEGTLAIELGATLEDMLTTIHPHPSLAEAVLEAAEGAAGVGVHLPRGGR